MGLQLWDELRITTRAQCASYGFSTAELYGTPLSAAELDAHKLTEIEANGVPLSADELEIADYMTRHSLSRQAAESFVALHKMPGPVAKMGPPKMYMHHCVIEYARTDEQIADAAEAHGRALDQYYAACRARTTIGPAFVGD